MSDLIKKDTVEEIVGHRDRALELYAEAIRLIGEANEAATRAKFSGRGGNFRLGRRLAGSAFYGRDDVMDGIRAELDREVWQHIFDSTALGDLFDTKRRTKFREQLEKDPPEVTVETVISTAMTLASRAGDMLDEQVVDLFGSLRRRFKSNSGAGFGRRLILEGAFGSWGCLGQWAEDRVTDLERAACLVSGREIPDRLVGLARKIRNARNEGAPRGEIEHSCFRAVWYKNGNLHVWITDDDVVGSLNQILARNGEKDLTG